MIPFHSELHRAISLYLRNNKNIPDDERIAVVKTMLEGADPETLLHYAACSFVTFDKYLDVIDKKIPELNTLALTMGKKTSDSIEARRKSKNGKNANNARNKENRALKRDAVDYYLKNRGEFANKNEAASYIAEKIVPAACTTVRDWLKKVISLSSTT
jgi:hypothetical protein